MRKTDARLTNVGTASQVTTSPIRYVRTFGA